MLLEVENLTVGVRGVESHLLRDVGFSVRPGEIHGLVGESGSGKTVSSLSLLGLLPPALELRSGNVRVEGRDVVDQRTMAVRHSPGDMAMVFQQPRSALNPTMRIGEQIARVLRVNQGLDRRAARTEALDALSRVGIPGVERVARAYPHQLSGGMSQRVMIAMALSCRPRLLVADEPTTALDVTIQAQIFDLIKDLVTETGAGVLLITHDLAAVAEMCDRVTVMYGGQVMETAPTRDLFADPSHPYTSFLIDSVERDIDPRIAEKGVDLGLVGCRFGHRCPHASAPCAEFPPMRSIGEERAIACVLGAETTDATA